MRYVPNNLFFSCILALNAALPAVSAVIINEVMTNNESYKLTAAGYATDWIELYNDGDEAVDLSGWGVSDNAAKPLKRTLPEGTVIAAKEYLTIFLDNEGTPQNDGEIFVSLGLSKNGEEFLGLSSPDGTIVYSMSVPALMEDVSYGLGYSNTKLVDSSSPMTYTVVNTTYNGVGGIGSASESSAGFTCVHYQFKNSFSSLDDVKTRIANSSYWNANPVTKDYSYISFQDGSTGEFPSHNPFPAYSSTSVGKNYFAMTANGSIYIPRAGTWTFSLGSDDGFELTIKGHGVNYSTEVTGGRSYATTLLQCNIPEAGAYSVSIIFFEMTGDAVCEFSAAEGSQSSFNTSTFQLVGADGSPLLHAGALSGFFNTDIGAVMLNRASMVKGTWNFQCGEIKENDFVKLSLRFTDGFYALLNGNPIGMFNTDGTSLYSSSTATAKRTIDDALTPYEIAVPVSMLVTGSNELLIYGYNDTMSDADFLLAPTLTYYDGTLTGAYFREPTPGASNDTRVYSAPTPVVKVSEPRGYKTAAFDVTLSCDERPGAAIYYTLDGSVPSASNGTLYTTPLHISSTTVLRAAVPDDNSIFQSSAAYTWLFLDDIITQSTTAPSGWPTSGSVNSHTMKYGMSSSIVSSDRARLLAGMTNAEHVATISMVTDLPNLFNASTGIYVNPGNDGVGWERDASIEMIDPVHGPTNEFQINAGIRIRGAASRSSSNPKHSFRLFFRERYGGVSRLNFPLFGDEGASSFKKVDLRTEQNHSWHTAGSEHRNTFVRDVFSRDSQRDMGTVGYDRSRYYHLFINGQYWGLYQTEERAEENFAESYFGSDKDNWDVVKTDSSRSLVAAAGTLDNYTQLHSITLNQGFANANSNNYWRVQGLNPDGTRNPDYPPYVDVDNLIIYVLVMHFTCDPDAPISEWSNFANNLVTLYDRTGASGGFKWIRHDCEHSLGAYNSNIANSTYGYNGNCLGWGTPEGDSSNFSQLKNFNPNLLHDRLMSHPVYKRRFADAVQKYFFNGGALTVAKSKARIQSRMDEIDNAIVGEAARWGNGNTRTDWLNACNSVMTFIENRHGVLLSQYRAKGWIPGIDAPTASIDDGAAVDYGTDLTLSGANTFYYTTDGSDPVDENGNISATAIKVSAGEQEDLPNPRTIFSAKSNWKYYDWGTLPPADSGGRAWNALSYTTSSDWGEGPGILGVSGNNGNTVGTATHRYINHGTSGTQVTTTYFRKNFLLTTEEAAAIKKLTINALYDDGYVMYINGVEVYREGMNAGTVTYDSWSSGTIGTSGSVTQNNYYSHEIDIPAGLLVNGTNVMAVEVHQCHGTSTDMYWDSSLATTASSYAAAAAAAVSTDVQIRRASTIKARAYNGSEWSALTELHYSLAVPDQDFSALKVTELMHAPAKSMNIDPYQEDDFSWIELWNSGNSDFLLAGTTVAGLKFSCTFEGLTLAPGERIIVTGSAAAYALANPDSICRVVEWEDGGAIKRKGDTITLSRPDEVVFCSFTFDNSWYNGASYDTGYPLVVLNPYLDQTDSLSLESSWYVGSQKLGTPGLGEPNDYSKLRVSELMFAPATADNISPYKVTDTAWIEFLNIGDAPLDFTGVKVNGTRLVADFSNIVARAGERVVLSVTPEAFAVMYPDCIAQVFGAASGVIVRIGDTLTVSDPENTILSKFTFVRAWHNNGAFGTGYSLVVVDPYPDQSAERLSSETEWKVGAVHLGTPGKDEPRDYSGLKIAELMHAPNKADNIDPYLEDDFSWVELLNCGETALDLLNCRLFGQKFSCTFGNLTVVPNERIVVTGNAEAFALAHPAATCQVVQWGSGGTIKRKGDTITLVDPDNNVLSVVTFLNTWFDGGAYNTGKSLVVKDLSSQQTDETFSSESAWIVSTVYGGTPGAIAVPGFVRIDVSAMPEVTLELEKVEGDLEVLVSDDLENWQLCPQSCWTLAGSLLTIDQTQPEMPQLRSNARFFRLRVK
ncbi:MAG: lamin tail domain-containing protein [Kiritimatiellae bacterium]|nr:lamin tail domain-containing protein [Kiritimatiellia bacterium]